MTSATVVHGSGQVTLTAGQPVVVPAGDIVISIDAAPNEVIRLDGRQSGFAQVGTSRLLGIDLTRSTGYHHLQVGLGASYWFGTDDAKLRLDGVRAMTEYLRQQSLTWTGQLMFSDGTVFRDERLIYGWLDQHADDALVQARRIAERPVRSRTTKLVVQSRGGRPVALRQTFALLRQRPQELLVAASGGPIEVAGASYFPRRVVAKVKRSDVDTPANRRTAWLLVQLRTLAAAVRSVAPDLAEVERCERWVRASTALLTVSSLAQLAPKVLGQPPAAVATTEELMDARYAATFKHANSLAWLAGWSPSLSLLPAHAYVAYADEVFQAFVVTVLADALGLAPTAKTLGAVQPAFIGSSSELYVDTVPPAQVLRSWRSYSSAPDAYRPDFLLSLGAGSVVLGDAKYRRDDDGASESSRKELLAYMAAYGLDHAVIFYPPSEAQSLECRTVTGQGKTLLEVTIGPRTDLPLFLTSTVLPAVAGVAQAPPWRS